MKRLLKSKLVLSLTALIMIAAAIAIPLSRSITRTYAQGTVSISEFSIPTNDSNPLDITSGPDGNLWFVEFNGDKISKITPTGTITEYAIPTSNTNPAGITSGPDGNLWFTEQYGASQIGKITPNGTANEYPTLSGGSAPTGITLGPDGNIWFTENFGNKIAKATTVGTITEYTIPTSNSGPGYITSGPDGNLWFTEGNANHIGKITTSGAITEYTIPTSNSSPARITTGPDGNLWFTEASGNKIGKITPSGTITEYTIPTSGSNPLGITTGPDGNIWFVEIYGSKIGEITLSGTITEYSLPSSFGYPVAITTGPDGNLWFTEAIGNAIGRVNLSSTPPTTTYSSNYAGYADTGSQTQPITYADVQGSWIVPSAQHCSFLQESQSAFWDGLGGFPKGKAIEQIATISACTRSSLPLYEAAYEMFPAPVKIIDPNKYPVSPGDSIQAEVRYLGKNMFTLTMKDATQGWNFSTTKQQPQMQGALSSAEWIAEAPTKVLTDFGTVNFSNCNTNINPISFSPMVYKSVMVISPRSNHTVKALPSNLSSNGTAFSVEWKPS